MPTLTRALIVRTAIELADREGYEAVTLRRTAGKLGVHVTSLYNHVPTRDALTDAIVAALVDEADLPLEPTGWEDWVRRFVEAIGAVAAAHPGAFAALQQRPAQGERASAASEAGLGAFAEAGLDRRSAYGALKATTLLAVAVGIERAIASRGEVAETALDDLPPDGFPHLRALRDEIGVEEDVWSFAVETLVAGLRDRISRPEASPARRRAARGSRRGA